MAFYIWPCAIWSLALIHHRSPSLGLPACLIQNDSGCSLHISNETGM
ncbi:hypothetical protein Patl1_14109 [Pistacia atlantica]|uniref:Uncharacterized protein n=1 Tax=Pistacia atlantica TaxID=434234 RepID=A0ACC1AY58_9ROSI|nr:hypothetical protein Patl1_14109 [Pistacia atlantica]